MSGAACKFKALVMYADFFLSQYLNLVMICTGWSCHRQLTAMPKCEQRVQIHIRLDVQEQSDQGLHCLPMHLHFGHILHSNTKLYIFRTITVIITLGVPIFRMFMVSEDSSVVNICILFILFYLFLFLHNMIKLKKLRVISEDIIIHYIHNLLTLYEALVKSIMVKRIIQ